MLPRSACVRFVLTDSVARDSVASPSVFSCDSDTTLILSVAVRPAGGYALSIHFPPVRFAGYPIRTLGYRPLCVSST